MMIYMEEYNKSKINLNEAGDFLQPSFDDLIDKSVVNHESLLNKITEQLQNILNKRFSGEYEKQQIYDKIGRLNFACPYCGDSANEPWKKRGNLYIATLDYHCFNCNAHFSYEKIAKDFSQHINSNEELYIKGLAKEYNKNKSRLGNLNTELFLDTSSVDIWGINREELIKTMGCVEIKNSSIEKYLRNRLQFDYIKFAWHPINNKLFIFNLTSDNSKVIGFQIRNFKAQPKYLTFKLDKIYKEIIHKEIPDNDETFEYTNSLSTLFGILHLDINKKITIFEGPLDSFLYPNAVATCSVKNDFPFDINIRYIYDNDEAGKLAAINKVKNGIPVFLWKKYLSENQIDLNKNKKIDLTDLYIYYNNNNKKIDNFEKYFSESKYDMYWL